MAEPTGRPATLGNLLDNGHDLQVWCNTCQGFGPLLRAEDLVARYGRDLAVPDLDKRLRCSRCGERNAETRVSVRNAPFSPGHEPE